MFTPQTLDTMNEPRVDWKAVLLSIWLVLSAFGVGWCEVVVVRRARRVVESLLSSWDHSVSNWAILDHMLLAATSIACSSGSLIVSAWAREQSLGIGLLHFGWRCDVGIVSGNPLGISC